LPEPYNNLATLYAKHGRYTEAREALETAIKANPNYGLAYENLGDLYLRLADSAYQRAHDLGQATGPTQQRLTDIQKIISPPKGSEKPVKKVAAPDDYTNRATSNITESPSFQFGGANGSLAMPPYMAPSN
jgi:tetratricopeptide (TPR) repeat protein